MYVAEKFVRKILLPIIGTSFELRRVFATRYSRLGGEKLIRASKTSSQLH